MPINRSELLLNFIHALPRALSPHARRIQREEMRQLSQEERAHVREVRSRPDNIAHRNSVYSQLGLHNAQASQDSLSISRSPSPHTTETAQRSPEGSSRERSLIGSPRMTGAITTTSRQLPLEQMDFPLDSDPTNSSPSPRMLQEDWVIPYSPHDPVITMPLRIRNRQNRFNRPLQSSRGSSLTSEYKMLDEQNDFGGNSTNSSPQ